MPYSQGECGDFASVQLRGDWEQSIVHSIDGKMAEDKKNRRYVFSEPYTFAIDQDNFRAAYKLLGIKNVYFFYFSKECLFLRHHSNRSEYSGNLRMLCLE